MPNLERRPRVVAVLASLLIVYGMCLSYMSLRAYLLFSSNTELYPKRAVFLDPGGLRLAAGGWWLGGLEVFLLCLSFALLLLPTG